MWIEINPARLIICFSIVTPFAGVWIEIEFPLPPAHSRKSHSLCGSVDLRPGDITELEVDGEVTPFAGVWIEIQTYRGLQPPYRVTPFAGVWIEIYPQPLP